MIPEAVNSYDAEKFTFSHRGSNTYSFYTYEATRTGEDACRIYVEKHFHKDKAVEYDEHRVDFMYELGAQLAAYDAQSWNGFNGSSNALDGEGFTLEVTLANGETITASGENAAPSSYHYFEKDLEAYFDPYYPED